MTETNQKQLGNTLWSIADQLRGAMDADDFRDYMLSFLFLRYLSDNYETAAKKELGRDYPVFPDNVLREGGAATPIQAWYDENRQDVAEFEKQMRRKVHYVIQPPHLWNSIANLARTQNDDIAHIFNSNGLIIVNSLCPARSGHHGSTEAEVSLPAPQDRGLVFSGSYKAP